MQSNKMSISFTAFIIIAVSIGALILGIISYVIYNNFHKKMESFLKDNTTRESSTTFSSYDETDDSFDDEKSSNTNSNSNRTSTQNNKTSNSSSENSSSSSIVGKESSKQNPLNIGEWGICSKYSSGEYPDVPVKVSNITRGSEAEKKVKKYCESGSSIYKYQDAKEGMEWAVIEYTVDLTKVKSSASGKLIKVDSKILGAGGENYIEYNGYSYTLYTMDMSGGYTKENIATGYFAATLPIGCTDYLIALGSSNHTQAFFKSK